MSSSQYYYDDQLPRRGMHRPPLQAQPQQDALVEIYILCGLPGHSHGPYYLPRYAVEKQSRQLRYELSNLPQGQPYSFKEFSRGYSCRVIDCMIRSWQYSEPYQARPGMENMSEVDQLAELARALWDYQCKTVWFEHFAKRVRDRFFAESHWAQERPHDWAFISVVFSWEHHFGLAIMDIKELASPQQETLPQMDGSIRHHWPHPADLAVLRYIIPENSYDFIQSSACNFVNSTWTGLCTDRDASAHKLAIALEDHFQSAGYTMPRNSPMPRSLAPSIDSGSSSASSFFQERTVLDLWRTFIRFFPEQRQPEPRQPTSPTSGRVRPSSIPFKFGRGKKRDRPPEYDYSDLRAKVEAWYNETFQDLLRVFDPYCNLIERFNQARSTLIISAGSELSANPAHELGG